MLYQEYFSHHLAPRKIQLIVVFYLLKGLQLVKKIEGCGDSLFHSILMCLEDLKTEQKDTNTPEDDIELKRELFNYLIENANDLRIKMTKEKKKHFEIIKKCWTITC
jgi:hypothetical protein